MAKSLYGNVAEKGFQIIFLLFLLWDCSFIYLSPDQFLPSNHHFLDSIQGSGDLVMTKKKISSFKELKTRLKQIQKKQTRDLMEDNCGGL